MAMAFESAPMNAVASSAWAREQAKSPRAKAEDIAYTINHALACTTLDTLNTPVEVLTQKYLGRKFSISICPGCLSGEHHGSFHGTPEGFIKPAARWLVAEWAGDWLGVIPTVAAQRFAPGAMETLGQALAYVAGPVFRFGANRSAASWALEQGIAPDGPTAHLRADEMYHHEIKHLPQAAVWTVASTALCLGVLRLMGDKSPLAINAASKLIGASVSIAGVLGTRALAPNTARAWDSWTSRNIYLPLTKKMGSGIGIESQDVDQMANKEAEFKSGNRWSALIEAEKKHAAAAGLQLGA